MKSSIRYMYKQMESKNGNGADGNYVPNGESE
jgi:hypothetical protein